MALHDPALAETAAPKAAGEPPLCEACLQLGYIEPAVAVDHILPIKRGGAPYPALAELASLCASHHNLKTRGEQLGRTLAPKVVNGCDVDGRPFNQRAVMILGKTKPRNPLCERCLKLQKLEVAVVGFELARGSVALVCRLRQNCRRRRRRDQGLQCERIPARSNSWWVQDVIGLSDAQLQTVMATAAQVPYEKRAQFLERIAAMLALRSRNFTDSDLGDVVKLVVRRTGSRRRCVK